MRLLPPRRPAPASTPALVPALAALLLALPAAPALAEVELSFYGGWQTAPRSDVTIEGTGGYDGKFTAGWEGRSFEAPPHYGLRATRWWGNDWGLGIDFNHAKVYADDETRAEAGLDTLEFTDGINILTLNGMRRFPGAFGQGRLSPYAGAGLGIAVPYVEVKDPETGASTLEYQITGPAVAWMAGASFALTDRWSVFGEYKGTYSINEADLDGGGTLSTDIVTNALNVGIGFRF